MVLLADLSDYQARDPQQALDAALAAVQSYCGWHISPPVTETVTAYSVDGETIVLPTLYLTSVTSITQDAVVLPATTYTWRRNGVIKGTFGPTVVTIAIVHGYDEWPADAKEVVLALAQRWIDDTRGLESKRIGPFSETYGPKMDQAQKDDLAPYTLAQGFA